MLFGFNPCCQASSRYVHGWPGSEASYQQQSRYNKHFVLAPQIPRNIITRAYIKMKLLKVRKVNSNCMIKPDANKSMYALWGVSQIIDTETRCALLPPTKLNPSAPAPAPKQAPSLCPERDVRRQQSERKDYGLFYETLAYVAKTVCQETQRDTITNLIASWTSSSALLPPWSECQDP